MCREPYGSIPEDHEVIPRKWRNCKYDQNNLGNLHQRQFPTTACYSCPFPKERLTLSKTKAYMWQQLKRGSTVSQSRTVKLEHQHGDRARQSCMGTLLPSCCRGKSLFSRCCLFEASQIRFSHRKQPAKGVTLVANCSLCFGSDDIICLVYRMTITAAHGALCCAANFLR